VQRLGAPAARVVACLAWVRTERCSGPLLESAETLACALWHPAYLCTSFSIESCRLCVCVSL